MSDASVQATSAPAFGRKLLKGGEAIIEAIFGKSAKRDKRWLYGQIPNLGGVVWQLVDGGELFAFEDELLAHFAAKAAEAKAAAHAAAAARAVEKEVTPKLFGRSAKAKATRSNAARRRARSA